MSDMNLNMIGRFARLTDAVVAAGPAIALAATPVPSQGREESPSSWISSPFWGLATDEGSGEARCTRKSKKCQDPK